jgi:hypothetical protein
MGVLNVKRCKNQMKKARVGVLGGSEEGRREGFNILNDKVH